MSSGIIHVAVAAIVNEDDEVFICKRHPDSHQGSLWEFPGGKVETNESVEQALVRELHEETGIHITRTRPLIRIHHDYGDKEVLLDVWKVQQYQGTPHGREDQPVRWVSVTSLNPEEFPAADVAIISALQLPERYLITGSFNSLEDFTYRLTNAVDAIRLVQLRLKSDWLECNTKLGIDILRSAEMLCSDAGASLLLNVPEKLRVQSNCKNIHADSIKLQQLTQRPDCELFSVSCHTLGDLNKAMQLKADFAVLSPVQKTSSHPDAQPLGWSAFQSMIEKINMPVFALGGVGNNHVTKAQHHGGQGVAGIGAFWLRGNDK